MSNLDKLIDKYLLKLEQSNCDYYIPSKQQFYNYAGINAAQCYFYLKYTERIADKIKNVFLAIEFLLDSLLHFHNDNMNKSKKDQDALDKVVDKLTMDFGWFEQNNLAKNNVKDMKQSEKSCF